MITLGMDLYGSGYVRRSEVFDSNVSEGQILEAMLTELRDPCWALVVIDRGVTTEANLLWLRQKGLSLAGA